MNDLNIAMDLMKCFPGSFINHNGEFIAHRRAMSISTLQHAPTSWM